MKRDPKVVQDELEAGRRHLECCRRLYEKEALEGRFFTQEHPHDAGSWTEEYVKKLMMLDGRGVAVVDIFAYVMRVDACPV